MSTETEPSSPMPTLTLSVGGVLIVLGVIAYAITDFASWTALIPAILGAVLMICGAIARKNTKLGVHIGLVVALLGLIGTSRNIFPTDDVMEGEPAAVFSAITFVLLLVYIGLGIRSFLRARRWAEK